MLNIKQNTLLAMLPFHDGFTVDSLHAATGTKKQTLRVILAREQVRLERLPTERNGKQGGQLLVYRLRPEARAELEKQLRSTREMLGTPEQDDEEEDPVDQAALATAANEAVPGTLVSAEYLLGQLSSTSRADRPALIRQIENYLAAADKTLGNRERNEAWHEVRSRYIRAEVRLTAGALRPYVQPRDDVLPQMGEHPILVTALDEFGKLVAAQVSGVLQGCFEETEVPVLYAEPKHLAGVLPTRREIGPNLIIFTANSDVNTVITDRVRKMLQQSSSNAVVMVLDAGNHAGLAQAAKACKARYAPNFLVNKTDVLKTIRPSAFELEFTVGMKNSYLTGGL